MNARIKDLWVAALRSGEYRQTKSVLRKTNASTGEVLGHCCLGVLCDLWAKEHGRDFEECRVSEECYGGRYSLEGLPPSVRDWADLVPSDPPTNGKPLSVWNDGGCTFKTIADMIEGEL